jgi:ATP-dependent Clp protease ATP-binding subunit ClpA
MELSSKDIKVYKSNHKELKNKFKNEFMKISHENIIFEAIKEIYMVEIDFMKGPEFEVMCYPDFSYKSNIEKNIKDKFENHWLNQGTFSWFKWCIEDVLKKMIVNIYIGIQNLVMQIC